MDGDLSQMENYPECIRYINSWVERKNFPQFSFLPRVPRVESGSTPWVWWQIMFRERCFHHNTVTITILPRVYRFNVLSHLCFWSCRSLFNLIRKKNLKKNSKNPSMSESDSMSAMISINKFKTIHEHHFDCLEMMFRLHYKTWCITRKYRNEYWTLHLCDSVIHELRVHFSWVVVKEPTVFHLTRLQIGKKILKIFKQKKILRKNLEIIRNEENLLNMYMERELWLIIFHEL